jgi:phosphatidate phosphatase PAH1
MGNSSASLNQANLLSGALDVIVVRHPDGSLHSSPFHVKFGKMRLLRSHDASVYIRVNDQPIGLRMKLNSEGHGYFPRTTLKSPTQSPLLSPQKPPEEVKAKGRGWWPFSKSVAVELPTPSLTVEEEEQPGAELSLCGHLIREAEDKATVFQRHKVNSEEFSSDPQAFISHPNLIVKLYDCYYDWQAALPMILSLFVFKQPLLTLSASSSRAIPELDISDPEIQVDSIYLNSEQLLSLQLKNGANTVTYTVRSSLQGESTLCGKVFLWGHTDKIVISDVDGTITRSDVLGHLLPMVGRDWSHSGVVKLFNSILANGFKVMYLTARAIGQVERTKDYLEGLSQDDLMLPEGPVITSPDDLFKSFVREVIKKQPHKFKAKVLQQIASLYPAECCPFYAGFGNRDTDAIAYRAAGVQPDRIFIINPKGSVLVFNNSTHLTTYAGITELAEQMFPQTTSDSRYSSPDYWKIPVAPLITDDLV